MDTFLTQLGCRVGPRIEALDFGHAEILAKSIDDNLEVVGEHVLTLSRDDFDDDDADRICRALSESYF